VYLREKLEALNERNYDEEIKQLKSEKQKFLKLSTKLAELEIAVDRDVSVESNIDQYIQLNLNLHELHKKQSPASEHKTLQNHIEEGRRGFQLSIST